MNGRKTMLCVVALAGACLPASAQTAGVFQWQLQPFCNRVNVTVTTRGDAYTLDGWDDQCGDPRRAPAIGVAVPNADGSVELGVHIVDGTGRPVAVNARLSLASGNGTWRDSAGNTGSLVLGGSAAGPRRPAPPAAGGGGVPPSIVFGDDGAISTSSGTGPFPFAALAWRPSDGSFSAGVTARATAIAASGFGYGNATAEGAVAMGSSWANGAFATASGFATNANGVASLAVGHISTADGDISTVLGRRAVTTSSGSGSFVYGDNSGNTDVISSSPNQFLVRASGGTVFYSTGDTTSGPSVALLPGAAAWSTLSDVNSKEHFAHIDADWLLRRLAAMPVHTWSFKAQAADIRHMGPTAQDFRAAFGLGEDPRRINALDADGVALAALQALEARTRTERDTIAAEMAALRRELDALRTQIALARAPGGAP
jgi:trimeric autotransporter adhesin